MRDPRTATRRDLRTIGGLVRLGAVSGILMSTAVVSYHVSTTAPPLAGAAEPGWRASARVPADTAGGPVLEENSLEFPVLAMSRVELQDSFTALRQDGVRVHRALDIMAPRHTPVRAVTDGVIARVSGSGAGGLALYLIDRAGGYCFYYAHLEAYAPGLGQGRAVSRGQVIGYVGTTGNAPANAPHLHFAIFKLRDRNRWWGGYAINPYPLLKVGTGASRPARTAAASRIAD
jgi:murein DD-endopeptidase MepM/ murein hydrolase activator NlpD